MSGKITITDQTELNRLKASIRNKALDAGNIAFSKHARDWAIERGVTLSEVARVLIDGQFSQDVISNDSEYRFQLSYNLAGRTIGVQAVCKTDLNGRVWVITVLVVD